MFATFEDALALAAARVLAAYHAELRWRDRIRAALTAFLCFCDEEPAMAPVLVLESLTGDPQVLERRLAAVVQPIAAVDAGRAEAEDGACSTTSTAEGAVGVALSIVQTPIGSSHGEALVKLVEPLMG